MAEWWASLTTPLQIFYGIAFVATTILLIQLVLALIGVGDTDVDVDAGGVDLDSDVVGDGDHGSGLHFISMRTVIAFFTGFGWMGVIGQKAEWGMAPSVISATVVGFLFMVTVFYLMKSLWALRHSGSMDYKNAIGKVGSVYMPIPPGKSGPGQVEIMIQGRLRVITAFTSFQDRIESQQKVKVVDLLDPGTLLVEPLERPFPPKG